MPIYEFYCEDCHTIFNFFSKTINTTKIPGCPKCGRKQLARQMSCFAITGKAGEDNGMDDLGLDESKMEQAMQMIAKEAKGLDENDPRKAADLMRKLSDMTGMELGDGMNEALARLERGEDPDRIEAEMGHLLESEDPFVATTGKKGISRKLLKPAKDDTLYDL